VFFVQDGKLKFHIWELDGGRGGSVRWEKLAEGNGVFFGCTAQQKPYNAKSIQIMAFC
jgi:hypothetical protein